MNLDTDICYSPGRDLSNDVFGLAPRESFNFFVSWTHTILGLVSESTLKALYIKWSCLFVYFFLFSGNSDQHESL